MSGASKSVSSSSNASSQAPQQVDRRMSEDIGWYYSYSPDPANKNDVQCKLCGDFIEGGIYMLKQHIAQIKGNVKRCEEARKEDIRRCKEALEESSKKKSKKQKREAEMQEDTEQQISRIRGHSSSMDVNRNLVPVVGSMDAVRDPELATRQQRKMKQMNVTMNVTDVMLRGSFDWVHVHDQLAAWAYENDIPFHSISTNSFQKACIAIGKYGPSYKPPSVYMLRESLLKKAVERTKTSLKEHGQEYCSVMIDTWSDRKMGCVMNLCVHCRLGTSFFKFDKTSEESHIGEYVFQWVDKCLEEIGTERVIQIVSNHHAANEMAKQIMKEKKPQIFWSSCAAHTVNIMLEEISKLTLFKDVVSKAKEMTIFIYTHYNTLSMMQRITEKKEIVRAGATRFATTFLTLESLLKKKEKLQLMFSNDAWTKQCNLARTAKGKQVEALVMSESFWKSVEKFLRVYDPLFRLLWVVDNNSRPSMGFVVGMLEDVKNEIKAVYKNKVNDYQPVIDIIEEKAKNSLYSPLHMAAYYLNPFYFYRDNVVQNCKAAIDGFCDVMELFFRNIQQQTYISNYELDKYKDGKGSFARPVAIEIKKNVDFNPASWWYLYGVDCPMIRLMAIKILNLTSSFSGCERNWSTFEGIHTKKRNRLESQRLSDLIYVKFNAKIKNQKSKRHPLASNGRCKARAWLIEGVNSDDEEEVVSRSSSSRDPTVQGILGEEELVGSDEAATDEDDEYLNTDSDDESDGDGDDHGFHL